MGTAAILFNNSEPFEQILNIDDPFQQIVSINAELLNINNIYFDQMVDRIYPTEFQLIRANSSDTKALLFGFESMYIWWYSFHQNLW